jgi:hypothetical protein
VCVISYNHTASSKVLDNYPPKVAVGSEFKHKSICLQTWALYIGIRICERLQGLQVGEDGTLSEGHRTSSVAEGFLPDTHRATSHFSGRRKPSSLLVNYWHSGNLSSWSEWEIIPTKPGCQKVG